MANPNFDTILSTTLFNYQKTLEDNIFKANPFMYWLQRGDRFRKEDGGAKIVEPLMGTKATGVGPYAGYATLPAGDSQTTNLTAAEYPWRQFYGTVAISGIEEAKNSGGNRVVSLLDSKVKQAEMSMTESMDLMLLGDGSATDAWWGLIALVNTANPSVNFGNIDRTTDTWWQAGYNNATAEALTLSRMTTAYNTVSKGNDHPDLVLTEQVLYEAYEALLQPQQRFSDSEAADGGFQNLLFKGATMFYDENFPSATGYASASHMYFLNSNYISLVGHKDVWFTNTPFVRPSNQDARIAQILAYGQLTASNCKRQGRIIAKSA